jgi:hypothetical protein
MAQGAVSSRALLAMAAKNCRRAWAIFMLSVSMELVVERFDFVDDPRGQAFGELSNGVL